MPSDKKRSKSRAKKRRFCGNRFVDAKKAKVKVQWWCIKFGCNAARDEHPHWGFCQRLPPTTGYYADYERPKTDQISFFGGEEGQKAAEAHPQW